MKHTLKRVSLFVVAFSICAAQTSMAGVGGFVDVQALGGTNTSAGATASNSIGFSVADGAVYMNKELGKGKVMIDLPFAYNTVGATTLGFALASKAQAYVNFGYDCGLNWTLGRFDSPFKLEANDTVGLNYAFQSALFANMPLVHQGLMLHYANSGFEVKALVSNNAGAPTRTTATRNAAGTITGDYSENYEFGFLAKYTHEQFWLQAGYYMQKPAGGDATGNFIDFMVGTKMGDLAMDLEALVTKAPVTGIDGGFGVAANFWYTINSTWSVGIRPEYGSKLTGVGASGTAANYSMFQVTAGPSCALTEDLKVRLNYAMASTKGNAGAGTATWTEAATSTTSHAGVLSAVYKF